MRSLIANSCCLEILTQFDKLTSMLDASTSSLRTSKNALFPLHVKLLKASTTPLCALIRLLSA